MDHYVSQGTVAEVESDAPDELAFVDETQADATLHLALTRPATWDPALLSAVDQNAVIIADLLYDGLTEANGLRLEPKIAVSWTSNRNYTEWSFTLDPERVAAGLTASVVRDSFDRLGAIDPPSAAGALLGDVELISTPNDSTVVFDLSSSNAGWPWVLSGVAYSTVGADQAPTGRFAPVVDEDDRLSLQAADGARVEISFVADGRAAYEALALGWVQAAVIDAADAADAAERFGPTPPLAISRFYALNGRSPALESRTVREAVLAALDRSALAELLTGRADPADGVAAVTVAGHQPDACGAVCQHDPARVAQLMADTTFPDLTVGYVGDDQAPVAELVAQQLLAAGFGAAAVPYEADALATAVGDGTVDVFSFGWAAPASSLDGIVAPLFSATGPSNVSGIGSVEVDEILAEAAWTPDNLDRWELLARAEALALDRAVLAPIAVAKSRFVASNGVTGVVVRADGSLDLDDLG